jgi:hypothetical protein
MQANRTRPCGALDALRWALDLLAMRYRNLDDPMAEIMDLAETLESIGLNTSGTAPELPVPMQDPLGFLNAAASFLSLAVLSPADEHEQTIH